MNTAMAINKPKKVNKVMNYKSCFDIIGPIMIGPSSSHTAGALAIGLAARKLFGGTPEKIVITMNLLQTRIKDMELILQLLAEFLD